MTGDRETHDVVPPYDLARRLNTAARDADYLIRTVLQAERLAQRFHDRATAFERALRDVVLAYERGGSLRPAMARSRALMNADGRYHKPPPRRAMENYLATLEDP